MVRKSALPDLVVFLNPANYYHGIRECTTRSIPTIGIVDSDLDPRIVTYAIPANMEVSIFVPNQHITGSRSLFLTYSTCTLLPPIVTYRGMVHLIGNLPIITFKSFPDI